jgi:hypothetical protein
MLDRLNSFMYDSVGSIASNMPVYPEFLIKFPFFPEPTPTSKILEGFNLQM